MKTERQIREAAQQRMQEAQAGAQAVPSQVEAVLLSRLASAASIEKALYDEMQGNPDALDRVTKALLRVGDVLAVIATAMLWDSDMVDPTQLASAAADDEG